MFKHLLVPLDGSRLAEAALPAAIHLAEAGAAVTLLHIIERDAPETVHGEQHLRTPQEAAAYLDRVARSAFPAKAKVLRHVHEAATKDVARGIADHLLELEPDTVVMTTHGRSGLRGLLFGSIAQQVAALGTMPVLLVRPGAAEQSFACRRILIPHDGVPAHEPALDAGTELARLCRAEVRLVMVIPTRGTLKGSEAAAGQLLPRATRAVLELAREDAVTHLHGHAEELRTSGITAVAEVARGDPAACIVKSADLFPADLIVLGTHGRTGSQAFWEGSVAAQVAKKANCTLLLVPVKQA
jgi:nucleotide-binding universal stress UspA family protein